MPLKSDIIGLMHPPNLFYRGISMKGTFKPGDKLFIDASLPGLVKKGDLIIFRKLRGEENDFVVHRVVATHAEGWITRGDNCSDRDREPVSIHQIVGRVTEYDRGGKTRKASNGWPGRFRAMMLHGRLQALGAAKLFLRRPYRIIRATGFMTRFWHPEIETIFFETPLGPLAKYVHEDKTVATCWIEKNRWWIKRPYDLIIRPEQERRLPGKSATAEEGCPIAQD